MCLIFMGNEELKSINVSKETRKILMNIKINEVNSNGKPYSSVEEIIVALLSLRDKKRGR